MGQEAGSASEPHERAPSAILFLRTGVPTRQQDLALQLDALNQAGCERIFRDVGSGTLRKRPQLDACLEYLRSGDALVVWRLDRLGRSLRHLVDVIAALEQRHVAFHSLREAIDTTTANGRLQLHLFATLAEFERNAEFGITLVMPRRRLCRESRGGLLSARSAR
ncbi:MAG: recombinase family protein [Solirubrobacteraceae bacterium]